MCIDLYSYISGGTPRVAAMTAFASQNNKMQPASLQDSSSVDEVAARPRGGGSRPWQACFVFARLIHENEDRTRAAFFAHDVLCTSSSKQLV